MSRYLLRYQIIAVSLLLILVACTQPQNEEVSQNIFETGDDVPVAAAQFLSLKESMTDGLSTQSTSNLHFATLEVEDLLGNPFLYITSSAPTPIGEPLEFGLTLTGNEWETYLDEEAEDGPWTTMVTGSSTIRDVFYSKHVGLDTLIELAKGAESLGGADQVTVVAPRPNKFLLRTQDNLFYDVAGTEPILVTQQEIKDLILVYETIAKEIAEQDLESYLEGAWACELGDDDCEDYAEDAQLNALSLQMDDLGPYSAQPFKFDLDSVTRGDGSLDVGRAAQLLAPSTSELAVQRYSGTISSGRQAHYPYQSTSRFGVPTNQFANIGYCGNAREALTIAPGIVLGIINHSTVKKDVILGCGPAAFTALAWREWAGYAAADGRRAETGVKFYGDTYSGSKYGIRNSYQSDDSFLTDKLLQRVNSRMQLDSRSGKAAIHRYLESCYFVNNPLTTPRMFNRGGQRWLDDQSRIYGTPKMNLVDAWTTTVGNPFDKGRKARMLKQRLVKDKKPIVALFPTSYRVTGSLHFSPVTKYDYRGWWIFKTLWVRTMDDITGKGEYNLSASWNIATGVFYIEER